MAVAANHKDVQSSNESYMTQQSIETLQDEKYCKAFQEMKDKAGSYTPTENEIYQRIYPELEKYILFLLWIEMTGYDTEENKKNRQIICTILKEELKLVEKEELEEE